MTPATVEGVRQCGAWLEALMKALFNGDCHGCRRFAPRCAKVYLRSPRRINEYDAAAVVLCDQCRGTYYKHQYRLDERHK